MNENTQSRLQQVIANRPKEGAKAVTAQANVVNFQDWLFFGTDPNIFVNVGLVPTSNNIVITYAVVVLQTPNGYTLSDASFSPSNANTSVAYNLATDSGTYNISQYGNQVQAWAFVQTNQGDQYSATQNYTVNP
jgi:hypothetical protein